MRFEDTIAQLAQNLGSVGANVGIVLDDQNAFLPAEPRELRRWRMRLIGTRRRGRAGEVHANRRSFLRLAVDFDVPAGLLDEAVDLRQPKSGPLTELLGRKKGFKRL